MPDNGTVYYAQVGFDRTSENPYNLFRKGDSQVIELYDRLTRKWVERQSLVRYTRNGGDGANVITKAQAEAVIGTWSW